jgi:ribosomal protein L7/L12
MKIETVLYNLTDALTYGTDTVGALRAVILQARDALRSLPTVEPEQKKDHTIRVQRNDSYNPPSFIDIYILDGKVTTSKIYAIKYVRHRSMTPGALTMGLKDAKDYVEGLPVTFADSRDLIG